MENKDQAEKLYRKGLSVEQIAKELEVNTSTVYRWKKDSSETEATDWDRLRELHNLAPSELYSIYFETFKDFLIDVRKDPRKLQEPKIADAISKHLSSMRKIDPTALYYGAMLDLIREINSYLQGKDPEVARLLLPHWEGIKNHLSTFASREGINF